MSLKLLLLWEIILLWHEVLPKVGKILILIREICLGRLIYWLVELQLLLLKAVFLKSGLLLKHFCWIILFHSLFLAALKIDITWQLRHVIILLPHLKGIKSNRLSYTRSYIFFSLHIPNLSLLYLLLTSCFRFQLKPFI